MRKPNIHPHQRGFTLMEIIISLAIAGVLMAVAIPFYRDYMIRAEVMGAFDFAESMRTKVMVDDSDGLLKGNGLLFEAKSTSDTVQLLYWSRGKAGDGLKGRMTAGLFLPRISDPILPAFDLEWRENGDWHCVSAAKSVKPGKAVLDAKYLPAACREAGPMPAAKPATSLAPSAVPAVPAVPKVPACPADQEMVPLPTGSACTAKCVAGQERDKANLTQCKPIVCGPNEEMHYNRKVCVTIPPKPTCGAGSDAFRGYTNDNDPTWACMNACAPGLMPGKAFKCVPDPNAKPAAASAPPAAAVAPQPAAKTAAPALRPGEGKTDSVKCRSCTAGLEDLCELVHEEITCTAPNNWCITFIDAHADGTKTIQRGCGNFNRVYTEWYQGTSDDDKCRERLGTAQTIDFTCTFGCSTDSCNDNLRPAEDSLYQAK